MRPTPSQVQAADELIELRLLRDMTREALGLPEWTPVSRITSAATTIIRLSDARPSFDDDDLETILWERQHGEGR